MREPTKDPAFGITVESRMVGAKMSISFLLQIVSFLADE
jgi:hypothetical protein